MPVADFSYQNDSLAQMIVDAWVSDDFRGELLKKANAKSLLAERGIFLQNPVIIDEEDVLERISIQRARTMKSCSCSRTASRVDMRKPQSLLETARLLMACVPNGI